MIGLHFHKDYAQAVLNALSTGKPIPPPAGAGWTSKAVLPLAGAGWTGNAMLTLAGILYAAVYSGGPHTYQVAGLTQADLEAMHPEKQEAVEQFFKEEIHGGIQYLSELTFKVMDDKYDEDCEPEVAAVVRRDNKGLTVNPIQGFKHLDS
jgi:hypothetical protein